jgi:hypothetical protein
MIIVAGPRIDPASLPAGDGVEVRAYVPDLHRHLAACDLAIVQGGLTTHDGADRPSASVPLLPARASLRAELPRPSPPPAPPGGTADGLRHASPEVIARAIAQEIGREVDYLPVASDGAARAAAMISALL